MIGTLCHSERGSDLGGPHFRFSAFLKFGPATLLRASVLVVPADGSVAIRRPCVSRVVLVARAGHGQGIRTRPDKHKLFADGQRSLYSAAPGRAAEPQRGKSGRGRGD